MSADDPLNTPIFSLPGNSRLNALTSRKLYIQRLNDVLHLSIERGDLLRARRAWAILARCKEFDWKSMWRTSMFLFSDDSYSSTFGGGRNLELLKKTMRHRPEEQECILQEIILRLADASKFREALDELDLYLPSFPYQDNPVLHSYAGLISLCLVQASSDENVHQSNGNSNFLREAQKHFNRTLAIDPDNAVAKVFLKEVIKQIGKANMSGTQLSDDAPSDEDMDVDSNDDITRLRPKRARQDIGKTQRS